MKYSLLLSLLPSFCLPSLFSLYKPKASLPSDYLPSTQTTTLNYLLYHPGAPFQGRPS